MSPTIAMALTASIVLGQVQAKQDDELTVLLKKKREALALAADVMEHGTLAVPPPGSDLPIQFGSTDFFKLAYTLDELAKVDVALAASAVERVKILESLVTKMRKYEQAVRAGLQAGLVTNEDAAEPS